MTDPTNDLDDVEAEYTPEERAQLQRDFERDIMRQPAWKPPVQSTTGPTTPGYTGEYSYDTTGPRHRVDPRRPRNPHTDDQELEDLYQDFYQERVRKGRVSWRLILLLVIGFIVAVLLVMAGIG